MERTGPELSTHDCWQFLTMARVGRLALSVRALPMILPVTYTVDGRTLDISLDRSDVPWASVHNAVVAFTVDEFDEAAGTGWMVQVQGKAGSTAPEPVTDQSHPRPSEQTIRLVPATVDGHHYRFLVHSEATDVHTEPSMPVDPFGTGPGRGTYGRAGNTSRWRQR